MSNLESELALSYNKYYPESYPLALRLRDFVSAEGAYN